MKYSCDLHWYIFICSGCFLQKAGRVFFDVCEPVISSQEIVEQEERRSQRIPGFSLPILQRNAGIN